MHDPVRTPDGDWWWCTTCRRQVVVAAAVQGGDAVCPACGCWLAPPRVSRARVLGPDEQVEVWAMARSLVPDHDPEKVSVFAAVLAQVDRTTRNVCIWFIRDRLTAAAIRERLGAAVSFTDLYGRLMQFRRLLALQARHG